MALMAGQKQTKTGIEAHALTGRGMYDRMRFSDETTCRRALSRASPTVRSTVHHPRLVDHGSSSFWWTAYWPEPEIETFFYFGGPPSGGSWTLHYSAFLVISFCTNEGGTASVLSLPLLTSITGINKKGNESVSPGGTLKESW